MSDWVMTLLVGFLFFALAGLAVLLIWLWHEPQGQQTQSDLPRRQAPKIVIRPRLFRTKEIVEQSRLPPPRPRPATQPTRTPPPTRAPTTTPPTTRPTPTLATLLRATPSPATRVTPPPVTRPTPPSPTTTRVTPPPVTPPPAQRTVAQATPEPVVTITNGPVIENTRFKVDFDTICKRTGMVVRACQCRGCREMKADAGIK